MPQYAYCPNCAWTGSSIIFYCPECDGRTRVAADMSNVPAKPEEWDPIAARDHAIDMKMDLRRERTIYD